MTVISADLCPPTLRRTHSSALPLLASVPDAAHSNQDATTVDGWPSRPSRSSPYPSSAQRPTLPVPVARGQRHSIDANTPAQPLLHIFTPTGDTTTHGYLRNIWAGAQKVLIWLLPMAVVLFSIAGAILLYNWMTVDQWGKLVLGINFRCGEQANRFVSELTTRFLSPVHTVRSFLLTQRVFSQEVLNRFCSMGGWGPLLRLVVAQRVSNSERPSWEQQYNVTVTEVDQVLFPNGSSLISAVRPRAIDGDSFYFPTRFSYPHTVSTLLGFDQHYGARKGGFESSLNIRGDRVEATTGSLTDSFPLIAGVGAPDTVQYPIGFAYYSPLLPPLSDGSIWSVGGGFNLQTFINQTISPVKLEQLGVRIIVKVNGTRVYETPVNTAGPDTHIQARQAFEMAGQKFVIECISSTTAASFYVTGWRYIAPALLIVGGCVVSILLFHFLHKHQQLSEASRNIGSWKRYSAAILQSTPNPMLTVDEDGRISGLNQAFLDLTGYTVAVLYQQSSLTDIISLCPPSSLLGTTSHDECEAGVSMDDDDNVSNVDQETQALHSIHCILQPGKHDVRIWVELATAASIGSDYIEATVTVSARTSSKMSQVLVFTDVTEAKQRDAKMAHLVRLTDQLNAQQAHVLTYLAHELSRPVADIEAATRVADEQDQAAVDSAHQHLTEMHQAVAELVGVSQPCSDPASLAQLKSRVVGASCCPVAAATIAYSNLDDEQAAKLILRPSSAQSFIKFCTVAGALKASRVDVSVQAPAKLTVQCLLPDSVSDEDLQQLNPEFDWTGLGRGCDFALLGIHLVILRRQIALAQGSLSRSGRRLSMSIQYYPSQ